MIQNWRDQESVPYIDTYIVHAFKDKMPHEVANSILDDWKEQGFTAYMELDGENVWLIGRR